MRKVISLVLNILIIIFGIIGTVMMFTFTGDGSGLMASGFRNLKFFTVLSNVICAIVSVVWIIFIAMKKKFPVLVKLMAAAAVGLTFIIIVAFLQPMYPNLNLYEGGNLWFHLILPVTAMIEFIVLDISASDDNDSKKKIPFKYTILSAIPSLLYGLGYLFNILINGIGEWPDTNDWYGFLNWGYPIGFAIFAFIILMNWGMAVLLRLCNSLIGKYSTLNTLM